MKHLKKYLMCYSLQEREKRSIERSKKEFHVLNKFTVSELTLLLIEYKAKYERKKNMFSFFTITALLSLLATIFSFFYGAFKNLLIITKSVANSNFNDINTILIAVAIIIALILLIIVILVYSQLQSIEFIHKKVLMIEEIIKEKITKKE